MHPQLVPMDECGCSDEEQLQPSKIPPRCVPPTTSFVAIAALIFITLSVYMESNRTMMRNASHLQSRLPSPPVPQDYDKLLQLHEDGSTGKVNEKGWVAQWRLAAIGQSCTMACKAHGQTCREKELMDVDTDTEIRYAASASSHGCKGTNAWGWDFTPSICTHKRCCGDGSCTGHCSYGKTGGRSCDVIAKPCSHHQRLCPCVSGNGGPVPTTKPEPDLDLVTDLDSAGLAALYGKNENFLVFLISPRCPICRGLAKKGGAVEQAAKKLKAMNGPKVYKMDTVANGMPGGYPCRYACEYFLVKNGGKSKILYKGGHADVHGIAAFAKG